MGPVMTGLGNLGILGLMERLGIGLDDKLLAEILAAGINLIITIPLNFVINKFWAYRKEGTKK